MECFARFSRRQLGRGASHKDGCEGDYYLVDFYFLEPNVHTIKQLNYELIVIEGETRVNYRFIEIENE